ncbi:MAG: HAD-IIIA family hydrolase [Bacilli bacterium]|nr:HAD-IIIA family hydrolase [Bacilli bacterium]
MVKMIVMDVDGTLTDGKIYMGENGELMKAFNCHDAVGIRRLSSKNIKSVIMTGRNSKIVSNRAKEMNVDYVFQGIDDKLKKIREISADLNIKLSDIMFVGDDINDLECLKACGYSCCPKDAVRAVKSICNFTSNYDGGCGVLREIVDLIFDGFFDK